MDTRESRAIRYAEEKRRVYIEDLRNHRCVTCKTKLAVNYTFVKCQKCYKPKYLNRKEIPKSKHYIERQVYHD